MGTQGHFLGTDCGGVVAEPFLCCNEVMEAHWGALRQRGPEQGTSQEETVLWPGLRGPEGCNSRARLWVPGAQARLWLLSRQNFPELRCCLDSPVERRQLSQQGHRGRLACQVGPRLPCGAGTPSPGSGWLRARVPRGHRLSLLPPISVGPAGMGVCGWGRITGTLRGTCLASLGPVVSWGPSASWAASVPLEGLGEISLMSLGCQTWGRTLERLGHTTPLPCRRSSLGRQGPHAASQVNHSDGPCLRVLASLGKGCPPWPPRGQVK